MLRLAVVIPTYNEVNNVQQLIDGIAAVSSQEPDVDISVIVIDDSSPDGTAALVEDLAPGWKTGSFSVRVIVKPVKNGLGAAYIFGFQQIENDGYDYILQMDADLSHDPKYIAQFIAYARQGIDFVVASRYIPGGGTPDWTFKRRFLSTGANIYSRTVLGRKVTDYTGGFNMYSAELLKKIDIASITATGYGFLLVLKYRALLNARSIAEIPIVFLDRTNGLSKMPSNTLMNNFFIVLKIKATRGR